MARICKRLSQVKEDEVISYLTMKMTYKEIRAKYKNGISEETIRKINKAIQSADYLDQDIKIERIKKPKKPKPKSEAKRAAENLVGFSNSLEISDEELFDDSLLDTTDTTDNTTDEKSYTTDKSSSKREDLYGDFLMLSNYSTEIKIAVADYIKKRRKRCENFPNSTTSCVIEKLQVALILLEMMVKKQNDMQTS